MESMLCQIKAMRNFTMNHACKCNIHPKLFSWENEIPDLPYAWDYIRLLVYLFFHSNVGIWAW